MAEYRFIGFDVSGSKGRSMTNAADLLARILRDKANEAKTYKEKETLLEASLKWARIRDQFKAAKTTDELREYSREVYPTLEKHWRFFRKEV